MSAPPAASDNQVSTSTTSTVATAGSVFDNLVRQVTEAVKPNLVEACIQAASNISECTHKEFSALSAVQQERRERDAALLDLLQPGNREQFAHASGVLSELENVEMALDNSKLDVAKAALKKGSSLPHKSAERLRNSIKYWEETLEASPLILSTIEHGYRILFVSTPPPSHERNNASARRHLQLVATAIDDLLRDGRIREVTEKPPYC